MSKGVGCGLLAWAIIGSLVLAPPVVAAEQGAAVDNARPASESFRRTTEEAAALAGGLAVRLNKSSLRDGDLLVVTVDVPSAGYLNVVSVGPDDVPTVLFPTAITATTALPPALSAFRRKK
jgi:hypothetical protein